MGDPHAPEGSKAAWQHGTHDRTTAPPDNRLPGPAGPRRLLRRASGPAHHLPQRRLRRGVGRRHHVRAGLPARARSPAARLARPGPAPADAPRRDGGGRGGGRSPRAGPGRGQARRARRLRRPGRASVLPDPAAEMGPAHPELTAAARVPGRHELDLERAEQRRGDERARVRQVHDGRGVRPGTHPRRPGRRQNRDHRRGRHGGGPRRPAAGGRVLPHDPDRAGRRGGAAQRGVAGRRPLRAAGVAGRRRSRHPAALAARRGSQLVAVVDRVLQPHRPTRRLGPRSSRTGTMTARLPRFMTEHALGGGNVAAGVVRVGDTVRKPAGFWTPAVEALLAHLWRAGFRGADRRRRPGS